MEAAGTLTFWCVRGSIPAPGLHTITFGGNTSCVSVEYREHVIIFDAGTGLRQLGLALLAREQPPITGSLFLTHTHWDHIQGLPFFTPAFTPENHFMIYGEARPRYSLVELMADQIQHPFFSRRDAGLVPGADRFPRTGERRHRRDQPTDPRHRLPSHASACGPRLCAPARRDARRLCHRPRPPA